jgi:hypothetical protein
MLDRDRKTARTAAAGAAMALLALAGCSSSGSDGAGTTTTKAEAATTTTAAGATTTEAPTTTAGSGTTEAPTTAPATTAVPGKETTADLAFLPEGVHYGYFKGIGTGTIEGQEVSVLTFDKVEFLTGAAAEKAAKAHGDTVDNDYYIVNDNTMLRKLGVIPDSQVFTLKGEGGSPETEASSATEVAGQPYLFKIEVVNVRGVSPITSIEAVFLP